MKDDVLSYQSIEIKIKKPNDTRNNIFTFRRDLTTTPFDEINDQIIYKEEDNYQIFLLKLDDYILFDRLEVEINVEYFSNCNKFFAWEHNVPSLRSRLSIKFPSNYKLKFETIGIDLNDVHKNDNRQDGLYSLEYKDWLLPEHGYVFQLYQESTTQP